MSRVTAGTVTHRRHQKIIALTKGYRHGRRKLFRLAKQALFKAGQYAYRDRRVKKRVFRAHWITVLNAAVRGHGLSYSQFIFGRRKAAISLNARVLAQLAVEHPEEFALVVAKVKDALGSVGTRENDPG